MESFVMNNCEAVASELLQFSKEVLELGNPITDDRLELFEQKIGYDLPLDFKYFLKRFNRFSLRGTEVMGIGDEFKESSLEKVYNFEHVEVGNKMPAQFLPFSNDGSGNHYCLDLSRISELKTCPIIFWQWDFEYESIDDVETCNENFYEWIKEVMIEWTLEDYNYDGTEK